MTKRTVAKAARLVLLHMLREGGALDADARRADLARKLAREKSDKVIA